MSFFLLIIWTYVGPDHSVTMYIQNISTRGESKELSLLQLEAHEYYLSQKAIKNINSVPFITQRNVPTFLALNNFVRDMCVYVGSASLRS